MAESEGAPERKPLRTNFLLQSLSKPPNPSGEEKVRKVRIEGRRRLCKLSSDSPPSDHGRLDLLSLDSLPREKSGDGDGGEDRIRDILSDLTERLDCLSMERPKRKEVVAAEPEELEFGSASSSFSSDVSPDVEVKEAGEKRNGKREGKMGILEELEDEGCILVESGEKDEEELGGVGGGGSDVVDVSDDDYEDSGLRGFTRNQEDDSEAGVLVEEEQGQCEDIVLDGSGARKELKYTLPGKVARILYPHQREGLRWLWSLHCGGTGGILGDDMGLGKTMQVSSYLAGLFHSRLMKRALIVAPKTLLVHWIKELTVVGLSEKIKDYYGTSARLRNYDLDIVLKNGGILLTTYDIVRNNFKSIRGDFFSYGEDFEDDVLWDYVILDEGHIIKNPSTLRAKSLMEIPSYHRIIISGTPIQNNLKELWALFNFCCPQLFGDKQQFKERYEYKILRANDKTASDRERYIGSTVAKELRERMKPYFLRRLKSEVFNENDVKEDQRLSRKSELIVWIKLSQIQRKLYEAFLNSELVASSITGSPLAAITILKKICDHPMLLTRRAAEEVMEGMDAMLNQDDLGMVEDMTTNLFNMTHSQGSEQIDNTLSCKICFILPLLENLISEGHIVLIFSQTRKMLNFIQEAITTKGYAFLRIDGTTKISERERIVNDFQKGAAPIFLLTSRVGGLGLTLTKADRVIIADPAWNPSTDSQSVDRAYRIGQKKNVLVYRLMTCGTIEEKIYKMQVFKGGLFKIATEQKDQTRYFSQKDLQELFSLPKHGFDVSLTQQQLHEEHSHLLDMDETLVEHITFLEKQGIAGVSHHSMLFSKTANVPLVHIEDEEQSTRTTIVRRRPSRSYVENDVNGAEHAFDPKTGKGHFKTNTDKGRSKPEPKDMRKETEERINRLFQMLSNNAVVSKLPDKGDKIRLQIAQLKAQLREMESSTTSTDEERYVDLDALAKDFQRGLRVWN